MANLTVHYIRKQLVAEPSKEFLVDFVNEQLDLGLRANEIVKLIQTTFFSQEIGDEERTITTYTDGTELDEETGIEQDLYIKVDVAML